MEQVFPKLIAALPETYMPINGVKAFLSQGLNHQIIFMEFSKDVGLSEHFCDNQWGVVLEGKIDLIITE